MLVQEIDISQRLGQLFGDSLIKAVLPTHFGSIFFVFWPIFKTFCWLAMVESAEEIAKIIRR
jgi:hypothetical protein